MRIRSTKPEFWRSERISNVSWDARLVLKGLESYVDDNGVGKYDMALIVGDLFQRDLIREPSRTLARVSEAISELHEGSLLWLYEADGENLLYIAFWETVQRIDKPGKGRFPRPDGTFEYGDSDIREPSRECREPSRALAPGTGEQGNRGTGEQSSSSPLRADVAAVLDHLDERIRANGAKVPTRGKTNLDAARLLLDADKRDLDDVHAVIEWATADEFWRSNILSASTLRRQYDKLRLASQRPRNGKPHHGADEDWL